MDNYEVEVHGAKVKVSVVDNAALIDQKVSELRRLMPGKVMGLDIKVLKGCLANPAPWMLLLCVGSHCLIIPRLHSLFEYYSTGSKSELARLLADGTICFVGASGLMHNKGYCDSELRQMMLKTGVEVGHLAARVLKKTDLENHKLHELAAEVGSDIKPQSDEDRWALSERIFTKEQIKSAMYDVYASYLIGSKLLGML